MATPVAHSLFGVALALVGRGTRLEPAPKLDWRWLLFAIVAANLPDIDFLPGVLIGDVNRFHQGATHSLVAAALFGAVLALWAARRPVPRARVVAVGLGAYLSHLLLDSLVRDLDESYGLPLLWPFSDRAVAAPITFLPPVLHGDPGESLAASLKWMLSWHNLVVVGVEIALMVPIVLAAYLVGRRSRSRAPGRGAGTTGAHPE